MDRYALLIDASYFFNAGGYALTGAHQPRRQLGVADMAALVAGLHAAARQLSDTPHALRVYWFDTVAGLRPSAEHAALAYLPGVKLRLSPSSHRDELSSPAQALGETLMALAQARAISDAVVVAGDDDLRTAWLQAQALGVRVHLLAAGDVSKSVSPALRTETDGLLTLDADWLRAHIRVRPLVANRFDAGDAAVEDAPGLPPIHANQPTCDPSRAGRASASQGSGWQADNSAKDDTSTLLGAARSISLALLDEAGDEPVAELSEHLRTNRTIPPLFDRRLIARTSRAIDRTLTNEEKRSVRAAFLDALRSIEAVQA